MTSSVYCELRLLVEVFWVKIYTLCMNVLKGNYIFSNGEVVHLGSFEKEYASESAHSAKSSALHA